MHDSGRTANLLGATALAVADVALAGVIGAAGVSASGAAALVVLSAFHHLSVTDLGRRVDLTQFAAARMVDSLEADGLVQRRPSLGDGCRCDSPEPVARRTPCARRAWLLR
jgi:MarR family transcriptional repressor of emrRAB